MMRASRILRTGSLAPRVLAAAVLILLIATIIPPAGAGTLRGQILTGPGGLPPGTIVVVTHLTGQLSREVAPAPDGSFVVPDLPEGLVTVVVRGSGNSEALPLAARAIRVPARGEAQLLLASEDGGAATIGTFNFLLYKQKYYNNKTTPATADPVTVTGTATTPSINIAMSTGGGTISGKVTAEGTSTPLPGLIVVAIGANSFLISFDRTDAAGNYRITGVPADSFYVCVNALFIDDTSNYVGEFYNNATSFITASLVTVTEGNDTPGINFGLALGGRISGRVSAQSGGAGLEDATVTARQEGVVGGSYSVLTDSGGHYRFRALPAGNYKVGAEADGNYLDLFYNNKASSILADVITVASGNELINVDFALPSGGSISGTVRDQTTNDPVANVLVDATNTTSLSGRSSYTDSNGQYTIEGLPTGSYTVSAYQMGLWYNQKTSEESADLVAVTAGGAPVTGIDFLGTIGSSSCPDPEGTGAITGRVTQTGGTPVSDAYMRLYMLFLDHRYAGATTTTDSDGNYTFDCLNPDTDYTVEATAPYTNLLPEYYDNADSAGAAVLDVIAGETIANVDFELAEGGGISGTITAASGGAPLAGVQVSARNITTGAEASTYTSADGSYLLSATDTGGLMPGTYRVWADNHTTANITYMPVVLARLAAVAVEGGIAVEWTTTEETDHAGFHVYRAGAAAAEAVRLTDQLLTGGPEYRFVDTGAEVGRTCWYWVGAVDRNGREERFGPVSAQAGAPPVPVSRLYGAVPNPFRTGATISYSLAQAGPVALRVFDTSGRLVRTLLDQPCPEGPASVTWDGRDDAGRAATGGVYYLSLVTRGGMMTGKVVLAR